MLNIVQFGAAVLEKKIFKHFLINHYVKVQVPGAGPYMTLGTSIEQTWIPLPQGCSLPNINAWPVVHEKIFEDLSKLSLLYPLLGHKRGQPLYLNTSESSFPKHVSHQVWLKLAKWFLRRSCLNENVNKRMDGHWTNCDGNSSVEPSAHVWSSELKNIMYM